MALAVLDSFALLGYLQNEASAETVGRLLQQADGSGESLHMTELNYAEVKYITLRKFGVEAWRETANAISMLPIEFHPLNRELADIAANFKAHNALSLADACAAALAKLKDCPVVTGDPEFKPLASEIQIHWI